MHGHDPADVVHACPDCGLTWSSRAAAEDCCADD
jgi:hypothetical protein